MDKFSQSFHISWGSLWRVFVVVLLGLGIFLGKDVIIAVLLAIVLSTAFDAVVDFLERKRIPRTLGTILVFLALIFLFGLVVYVVLPIVLEELSNFLSIVSQWFGEIDISAFEGADLLDTITNYLSESASALFSGSVSMLQILGSVFGGIVSVVVVFVLTFHLTISKNGIEKFLSAILPATQEEKWISFYFRVRKRIGRWILGQFCLSFIVGLIVFIGLTILGVKYALVLGLLAGILELIPYVGPILGGAVAILVALTNSWNLALYTLIFFILAQQLENHILVPFVTKYTASLNPAVVVIALLLGAKLLGLPGLILAIPTAVAFSEFLDILSASKEQQRSQRLI